LEYETNSSTSSGKPPEAGGILSVVLLVLGFMSLTFLLKPQRPDEGREKSSAPEEKSNYETHLTQLSPSTIEPQRDDLTLIVNPGKGQGPKPSWQKLAEVCVALATVGLLVVNIFQFRLTREQVHIGQRAYLVFQHSALEGEPSIGSHPHATVEIANSGLTPATDIFYSAGFDIVDSPELVTMGPERPSGYIGSGGKQTISAKLLTPITEEQFKAITTEEFVLENNRLIINQTPHLYLRAFVRYKDVFGASGETTVCSVYAQKTFVSCSTDNDLKWKTK
jgi:hypothetical protein